MLSLFGIVMRYIPNYVCGIVFEKKGYQKNMLSSAYNSSRRSNTLIIISVTRGYVILKVCLWF